MIRSTCDFFGDISKLYAKTNSTFGLLQFGCGSLAMQFGCGRFDLGDGTILDAVYFDINFDADGSISRTHKYLGCR